MPDITALLQAHGYWVLGLVIALENAGLPVPGETALLTAGFLTSAADGRHLDLWAVVLVAFLAATAGDNIGFWLGRRVARPRLAAGRRFLFLTPARLAAAERYFAKYGLLTVFVARFVTGLRVVAGPAAGAAGMRWGRFLAANAAGAVVWAAVIALVGHSAGHAWEAVRERLGSAGWVVLAVVVVGAAVWRVSVARRAARTPPPTGRSGEVAGAPPTAPAEPPAAAGGEP